MYASHTDISKRYNSERGGLVHLWDNELSLDNESLQTKAIKKDLSTVLQRGGFS